MEQSLSHLDSLLSDTNSALSLLNSLSDSFRAVEAQTTSFQEQCEGLLKEQRRITGLADDLDKNLKYYNYLEPVTKRLNAPGAGNFVRSSEFSEMLSRLDECLEYMVSHVCILRSSGMLSLIAAAVPSRSSNVPLSLPPTNDEGIDVDPGAFRCRFA